MRQLKSHIEEECCGDFHINAIDNNYPLVKDYGENHGEYPDNLNITNVLRAGAALALGDEDEESRPKRNRMIDSVLSMEVTEEEAERIVPTAMLAALLDAQFAFASHMAKVLQSDELRERVEKEIGHLRSGANKKRKSGK